MTESDKSRETAQDLGSAKRRLDFAIDALFDARKRKDIEDLEFYREAVVRSVRAVESWAKKLTIKSEE